MRSAIKRMRHRSESREGATTETPKSAEPEQPAAELTEPESDKQESEPNRSRAKPAKSLMFDFLDDESRDSDGTFTVVYRLEPVINRRHKEHFIARKTGRLTQEDLPQEFGSGVYELWVKNINKKLLYREPIAIHHYAHPPRVDPAEIVERGSPHRSGKGRKLRP